VRVPSVLYYDLASPYAYLAVSRAAEVLGEEPRLQPVLVGAIFGRRGRGSWAHPPERTAGEAEIERRAARYGLPPLVWPDGWPLNSLTAMRAAVWADRQGRGPEFARAVFEREFAHGEDVSGVDALEAIGRSVGVEGIREAVAEPEIKQALLQDVQGRAGAGDRGALERLHRRGDEIVGLLTPARAATASSVIPSKPASAHSAIAEGA
jgi:2-hydroxychromene-2-carboxylate isomerase